MAVLPVPTSTKRNQKIILFTWRKSCKEFFVWNVGTRHFWFFVILLNVVVAAVGGITGYVYMKEPKKMKEEDYKNFQPFFGRYIFALHSNFLFYPCIVWKRKFSCVRIFFKLNFLFEKRNCFEEFSIFVNSFVSFVSKWIVLSWL